MGWTYPRIALLCTLVGGVGFVATVSHAGSTQGEQGAAQAAKAFQIYKKAKKTKSAELYTDALEGFRKAAKMGVPDAGRVILHYNIGQCLRALERYREAYAAYERALEWAKTDGHRKRVQPKIDEMAALIFGTVRIECGVRQGERVAPIDARVRIGDGPQQACPTTYGKVLVGPQTVEGTSMTYGETTSKVTVKAGATTKASLVFSAPAPTPTVEAPSAESDGHGVWAWTAIGLGAGLGVWGAVQVSSGLTLQDEWNTQYDEGRGVADPAQARTDAVEWVDAINAGYVFLGIGGGLLATGALLFVLDGDAGTTASRIHLAPHPHGAAVVWRGAW